KTQSGQEGGTPASSQLGVPRSLPCPFSQLGLNPSPLLAPLPSLSASPTASPFLPAVPLSPSFQISAGPQGHFDLCSPQMLWNQPPPPHHPTTGAADPEAPQSQE
ncbi:hypothetical protein H1C71_005913, partial [Ictidomys tridecemlineatus]